MFLFVPLWGRVPIRKQPYRLTKPQRTELTAWPKAHRWHPHQPRPA